MRTETTNIYKFDELSDEAKEEAREWYRDSDNYGESNENHKSLVHFCRRFGVSPVDWEIGPYVPSYMRTDATPKHFRGVRLRDFTGEEIPTGYYIDCSLWGTFYNEFKTTGDAYHAFNKAVDKWVSTYVTNWEWSLEDEQVDESLRDNGYEFTEDGTIY